MMRVVVFYNDEINYKKEENIMKNIRTKKYCYFLCIVLKKYNNNNNAITLSPSKNVEVKILIFFSAHILIIVISFNCLRLLYLIYPALFIEKEILSSYLSKIQNKKKIFFFILIFCEIEIK